MFRVYPESDGSQQSQTARCAVLCPALPSDSARSFSSPLRNLRTFQLSNLPTFRTAIPFRIRTYEKHAPNPRRMNTSKTKDLKPFRIRTYEKTPGGAPLYILPKGVSYSFQIPLHTPF
jgi:hypothetical protein